MSYIRLSKLRISNFRSFKNAQTFDFPVSNYGKPVSIIGYNNSGKTNMINAILYGIGEKFVNSKSFELLDLHNLDLENQIEIKTRIEASPYGENQFGPQTIAGEYTIKTEMIENEIKSSVSKSFFGANKHYNIFYINFHNIKDEIAIKKSSWGTLTSFLSKHIKKLIDSDPIINARRENFIQNITEQTHNILNETSLSGFIENIRLNYINNLRNNNCYIEFGVPNYDDIFLQMLFKIGLNGNNEKLLPINQLGDGYISMFVMAVIQSIAESNIEDKCLFLFEEPESFLHENHQEYFYKMVLCQLAENGHQVIYTTHSDKMIDIFDTKSIIRLEFDEDDKKTVVKYNNLDEFSPTHTPIISIENFNSFIKSVEPNINKILFSRKILLVEGPNDLLTYNFIVEKKAYDVTGNINYSKAFLNFKNISIAVHHGKATAFLVADLCKHFGINFYLINDWDLDNNNKEEIYFFETLDQFHESDIYRNSNGQTRNPTEKGILTTNWKLINSSIENQIHFNHKNLEEVIGYDSNDKNSLAIWNILMAKNEFETNIFPESLADFLEID
ncbi:AAA family ATPase [Chryseobacterium sp. OV279]|uniref:AAA family ATPase n=1 Tax=Chryseobacterium sp. OV279 TaxID=1500285 RepID=UPI00091F5AC4|nr:AAA family ATPase [Chryseobacterium sp. OV279]SHF07453.1 Predicted ATP-dependent endonuclease of the OLD family, contains P-loop ATPase and TOPRIM domains [Chryseobacterium sp. OV279]